MTKMKAKKIEAGKFESVLREIILKRMKMQLLPSESDIDILEQDIIKNKNGYGITDQSKIRSIAEHLIKSAIKNGISNQKEFDKLVSIDNMVEFLYETIEEILPKFNVEFDLENLEFDNQCDENVGVQTVGDFSYWGGISGGDWEHPVYFILYIDENGDIAGYVPEEGNVYNKSENSAFGNNHESDVEAIFEQYGKKVKDDSYLNEDFDFDKIKEDIKNKIEIVGE